jgi:hypothetical protein
VIAVGYGSEFNIQPTIHDHMADARAACRPAAFWIGNPVMDSTDGSSLA